VSEAPALPAAIAAEIGRTYPPVTEMVEAGAVRRYLQAMGEPFEPYLAADGSGELGFAPPLFLQALGRQPLGTPPPREDGLGGTMESNEPDLPLRRAVVAGGEWEFNRPVRIGERITVQMRIANIERKTGRQSGEMYLLTKEMQFLDAAGDPVAVWRHFRVRR
jgi:acyl dehydratase